MLNMFVTLSPPKGKVSRLNQCGGEGINGNVTEEREIGAGEARAASS